MPLPRLLAVARNFDPRVVEDLRAAGFPTMLVDDVRGVPNAVAFRAPEVLLLDLGSFAPSFESAFEAVRASCPAPLVILETDEARLMDALQRGAEDGHLKDAEGLWKAELPGLVRRAFIRRRGKVGAEVAHASNVALLESIPGAILALDAVGHVIASNSAARRLFARDDGQGFGAGSWFEELGVSPELARRLALSGSLRVEHDVPDADPPRRLEVNLVTAYAGDWPVGVRFVASVREQSEAEVRLHRMLAQDRARRLVEYAGDMLLLHDTEGRVVDVNRQTIQALGYTREELLNLRVWDLDPHARPGAGVWARLTEGGAFTVEASTTRKDGSSFPTEVRLGAWEEGGKKQIVAFIRDISERRRAQEEQALARAVFDAVADGIMVTDTNNKLVAVNPAFTAITGYPEEEVLGRDPSFLKSGRHPPEFYREMWQRLHEDASWEGELWNKRRDGTVYPSWMSITGIKDRNGRVDRYVGIFANITERKRAEEIIRHQALHDALTGLPNRALFHQRLAEEVRNAGREGRKVALLFIDLDRFKFVNDTMGHEAGDLLLQQVAQRLSSCARHTDTVSRLGGDEFTLILAGLESPESIRDVPKRILAQLEAPFDLGGREAHISGSVGIAFYPDDAGDLESLVRNADQAMYQAKSSRNAIRRYGRA